MYESNYKLLLFIINPYFLKANSGKMGDNDPIDIVDIGSKVHPRGAVVQVLFLSISFRRLK
jgi:hypothetical protein